MTEYTPGDIALINDYTGQGDLIGNLIYDGEKSRHGRADWTHAVGIVSETGDIVEAMGPGVQRNNISEYPAANVTVIHLPLKAYDPRRAYAVRFWLNTVGQEYGWPDFIGLAVSLAFGLNVLVHSNRMPICSENCARATESATDHGYPYTSDAMMPQDLGVYWGLVPSGKPLPIYKRWGLLIQTLYWAVAPWKHGLKFV